MGSVFIPLCLALAHKKRIPDELIPIYWILIVSLTCDVISISLLKYAISINTLLIGNIYLFAQFSLLVWIFVKQLQSKKVINIVYIFFIFFYVINISFFQGPWIFNSISNVLASLILIALCLYYFYRLLYDMPTVHIHSLPMLWISFAVLTYYAGNFFLFLVSNYLVEGARESHRIIWILHNLLNITKNILFAIALWQSYRKVRSFSLSSSAP